MQIYAMYDSVAGEYGPLFEAKNSFVAMRNVRIQLEQVPENYRHEYKLYMLGVFDRETGILTTEKVPEFIEILENTDDE